MKSGGNIVEGVADAIGLFKENGMLYIATGPVLSPFYARLTIDVFVVIFLTPYMTPRYIIHKRYRKRG